MALQIPSDDTEAVKSLIALSEEQYQAFLRAVQSIEPKMTSRALAQHVSSLTGFDVSKVQPLITILGSLFVALDRQGLKRDEFIDAVVDAAKKQGLVRSENEERLLRVRLSNLLALGKSIGVSAKASSIIIKHEKVFLSATIYSDIRPIFTGDDLISFDGAVLVHMLEISAYTDGQRRSEYFALDSSDLATLKTVIDRAVRKEKAIRDKIKTVPLLEGREGEQQ